MPKRHSQSLKDECIRLRGDERLSICELSRRFNLPTGTIYPWVKHMPLERREWRAPSTKWTLSEITTLRQVWPFSPWSEIARALPGRSRMTITAMASLKKIKRHREANSKRSEKVDPLFKSLRRARENLGMTRKQLAKKVGYHRVQMARWELGEDTPTWHGLKLWAQVLDYRIILEPNQRGSERYEVFRP